jgi:hypothetical protein
VYDLAADPNETRDLAASRADLVRQAQDVLRRESLPNEIFPVPIPGVTTR